MRKRLMSLLLALLVLAPIPAAAENLIVFVSSAIAGPAGIEVVYEASPQSGLFSVSSVATVPYSSANIQITSAIADHAKALVAPLGVTVGGGDVVKVFGGPSN